MASKKSRLDKKTLLVLGGVLGFETIVCAGIGMSVYNRKSALEQTLAGKETALANVRTISASLPALQAQYLKMQAQVQFLERALPPAEYIPTLLGQVEQTAIASGVAIQEFRPKAQAETPPAAAEGSAASPDAGVSKMQFDVSIRGDYTQIQRFLQSLTRFRKILALDSLTLNPSAATDVNVSPVLTGSMSFTAYVLPPSTDAVEPVSAPEEAVRAAANPAAVVAPAADRAAQAARQAASERGLAPRDNAGASRTSEAPVTTPRG